MVLVISPPSTSPPPTTMMTRSQMIVNAFFAGGFLLLAGSIPSLMFFLSDFLAEDEESFLALLSIISPMLSLCSFVVPIAMVMEPLRQHPRLKLKLKQTYQPIAGGDHPGEFGLLEEGLDSRIIPRRSTTAEDPRGASSAGGRSSLSGLVLGRSSLSGDEDGLGSTETEPERESGESAAGEEPASTAAGRPATGEEGDGRGGAPSSPGAPVVGIFGAPRARKNVVSEVSSCGAEMHLLVDPQDEDDSQHLLVDPQLVMNSTTTSKKASPAGRGETAPGDCRGGDASSSSSSSSRPTFPTPIFRAQLLCNVLGLSYGVQVRNEAVLASNLFGSFFQVLFLAAAHYASIADYDDDVIVVGDGRVVMEEELAARRKGVEKVAPRPPCGRATRPATSSSTPSPPQQTAGAVQGLLDEDRSSRPTWLGFCTQFSLILNGSLLLCYVVPETKHVIYLCGGRGTRLGGCNELCGRECVNEL